MLLPTCSHPPIYLVPHAGRYNEPIYDPRIHPRHGLSLSVRIRHLATTLTTSWTLFVMTSGISTLWTERDLFRSTNRYLRPFYHLRSLHHLEAWCRLLRYRRIFRAIYQQQLFRARFTITLIQEQLDALKYLLLKQEDGVVRLLLRYRQFPKAYISTPAGSRYSDKTSTIFKVAERIVRVYAWRRGLFKLTPEDFVRPSRQTAARRDYSSNLTRLKAQCIKRSGKEELPPLAEG